MGILWAFILEAVCFFALGILISDLIIFKKDTNLKSPVSYEVSMEQIEQWIKNELDDKRPFDQQILEWLRDSENKANMMKTSSQTVECIEGCIGSECPCFPAREDCCENFKTGNCKVTININQLCGIKEYERDPSLLTVKEAETLANIITKFISRQESE